MKQLDVDKLIVDVCADEYTHYENNKPVTFIADMKQLRKLVNKALAKGRDEAVVWEPPNMGSEW